LPGGGGGFPRQAPPATPTQPPANPQATPRQPPLNSEQIKTEFREIAFEEVLLTYEDFLKSGKLKYDIHLLNIRV